MRLRSAPAPAAFSASAGRWARHHAAVLLLAMLAACRPPAADDYVERVALDAARERQREPLASPDTEGAVWADGGPARIVYGQPGDPPLMALACEGEAASRRLTMTRFAATDREAKALMALIGNGHIARLKVDAEWNGRAWLWRGSYEPDDPGLEVLTGPRRIEATIPGAGTVELNPSPRPRELVERCRRLQAEEAPPEEASEPPAPA